METMTCNIPPLPAWSWLHLNGVEVTLPARPAGNYPPLQLGDAERFRAGGLPTSFPNLSQEAAWINAHANDATHLLIPSGEKVSQPIVLHREMSAANPTLVDQIYLTAGADAEVNLILSYASGQEDAVYHCGALYVDAGPRSVVKVTIMQTLGAPASHLQVVHLQVREDANVSAVLCDMGAGVCAVSTRTDLLGENGRGDVYKLYLAGDGARLDENHVLNLLGRGTVGNIIARGALWGNASKAMKSTLDFRQGSTGSVGREEEVVLTLSDRVINRSVPLLLCGEDDVEGSHATSSGQPDAARLYYLMSRGLSPAEAKRLLVEATMMPVIIQLLTEEAQAQVKARVQEVISYES